MSTNVNQIQLTKPNNLPRESLIQGDRSVNERNGK